MRSLFAYSKSMRFGLVAATTGTVLTRVSHAKSPDNIDCHNPVCNDSFKAFRIAAKSVEQNPKRPESSPFPSETSMPLECPLDRSSLGERTWSILHTIAAYYPEQPTETQRISAVHFIESLALLYPCPHCAQDFQESIKRSPPRVESRSALMLWLCELHNEVNGKLGVASFPCDISALDKRWKIGESHCWMQEGDELDSADSREDSLETANKIVK